MKWGAENPRLPKLNSVRAAIHQLQKVKNVSVCVVRADGGMLRFITIAKDTAAEVYHHVK